MTVRFAIYFSLIALWFSLIPTPKGNCVYTSAQQDSDVAENFSYSDPPSELFPITEGHKYGYMDRDGRVVVEPTYDQARQFSGGLAAVAVGDICHDEGLWGYIDSQGSMVMEPQFLRAESFHDGLAAVETNDGWGYIDKSGQFAVSPGVFHMVSEFSDGIAAVERRVPPTQQDETAYAYIDMGGQALFDLICLDVGGFSEGMASVTLQGYEHAFVDRFGAYIIGPDRRFFRGFSEGLALFTEDFFDGFKSGFVDQCGETVIEPIYDDALSFHEGLAAVAVGSIGPIGKPIEQLWGYIDTKGDMVIEPQFSLAWDFADGLAPVYVGGVQSYSDGYCPSEGEWGYIDHSGNFVVGPQFELAREFDSGLAKVEFDYVDGEEQWGYINTKGEIVWSGSGSFYNACYPSAWGPAGWM
jgi:hypothetical protein